MQAYLSDCNDRKNSPDESRLHLFSSFWQAIHVWWSRVFSSRTPQRISIGKTNIPSKPICSSSLRSFGTIFSIKAVRSLCVSVNVDDAKNINMNGRGSHNSKWYPSDSVLKQPRKTRFLRSTICLAESLLRRSVGPSLVASTVDLSLWVIDLGLLIILH